MNAYHLLIYQFLDRGFITLRFVYFFLIFSLNYQQADRDSHGVVFVSTNEKRLQNQV